ncbi:endonuclease III domain-containing protein [Candidatus Omnitrophota bacterium]
MKDKRKSLKKLYDLLNNYFGDLGWWPAETDFEVIIGAILTQNTSWTNVEKAIFRLKQKGLLRPSRLAEADLASLARAIRPAGYFRVKARRLRDMGRFVMSECGGRLARLKKLGVPELREKLLAVKGVGPETADSILVYAMQKPVFVVDAYTKRIFERHGLIDGRVSYDEVQKMVHKGLPMKTGELNQFHALLVETGKRFCRKKAPLCEECPLKVLLKQV